MLKPVKFGLFYPKFIALKFNGLKFRLFLHRDTRNSILIRALSADADHQDYQANCQADS